MVGEHHKERKFRFAPLRWYYKNKFFFMLVCCVSVEVEKWDRLLTNRWASCSTTMIPKARIGLRWR